MTEGLPTSCGVARTSPVRSCFNTSMETASAKLAIPPQSTASAGDKRRHLHSEGLPHLGGHSFGDAYASAVWALRISVRNEAQRRACDRNVGRAHGNTPAACRKCYVHPAVLDAYLEGQLPQLRRRNGRQRLADCGAGLSPAEAGLLRFLRQYARNNAAAD